MRFSHFRLFNLQNPTSSYMSTLSFIPVGRALFGVAKKGTIYACLEETISMLFWIEKEQAVQLLTG